MCKKASNKLHALSRVSPYMSLRKKKILMNAFFSSQFSYCPVIWMFHNKTLHSKINQLHERCLRIIYNDRISTFEDLLSKDNSVTIHQRNLQRLATEMFKVYRNIAPNIVSEIFKTRKDYKYRTRNMPYFTQPIINTTQYGRETVTFLGPRIWNILPQEYKDKQTLEGFKSKIKKWKPENCPCRGCQTFIPSIGFI